MAVLKPDNLSRKTMREILSESNIDDDNDLKIGDAEYRHLVMESDYDEGYQISADEGDLVFFDMITYGYGENITWSKLEEKKTDLENWAIGICERHHCNYKIFITANYW